MQKQPRTHCRRLFYRDSVSKPVIIGINPCFSLLSGKFRGLKRVNKPFLALQFILVQLNLVRISLFVLFHPLFDAVQFDLLWLVAVLFYSVAM